MDVARTASPSPSPPHGVAGGVALRGRGWLAWVARLCGAVGGVARSATVLVLMKPNINKARAAIWPEMA